MLTPKHMTPGQSLPKSNIANPVWNEIFVIDGDLDMTGAIKLKLLDPKKPSTVYGEVTVPVSRAAMILENKSYPEPLDTPPPSAPPGVV